MINTLDKNPAISVIVPIYNMERFIIDCVQSIIQQDFENFELILIDDGSIDNSATICDKLQKSDNRILVFHQENAGVSSARKLGVANASGKYIFFVDADDTIPYNALSILYSNIKEYDILVGQRKVIYKNGKELIHGDNKFKEYDSINYIRALLKMELWIGPCCRLINKELFDINTLDIPRSISNGEDLIMNLRLAVKTKKNASIEGVVYNVNRTRDDSLSKAFKTTLEYEKKIVRMSFDPIFKYGMDKLCYNEMLWFKGNRLLAVLNSNYSLDIKDPFVSEFIDSFKILKWNIKNSRIKIFFMFIKTPLINKKSIEFLQKIQKMVHLFLNLIGEKKYGLE